MAVPDRSRLVVTVLGEYEKSRPRAGLFSAIVSEAVSDGPFQSAVVQYVPRLCFGTHEGGSLLFVVNTCH